VFSDLSNRNTTDIAKKQLQSETRNDPELCEIYLRYLEIRNTPKIFFTRWMSYERDTRCNSKATTEAKYYKSYTPDTWAFPEWHSHEAIDFDINHANHAIIQKLLQHTK
jgi:hypothetical protein